MSRQGPRRYERTDRVNEQLVHVLAEEVGRLADPRLGLVTITGVEVTSDLGYATVYWSALDDDVEDAEAGLRSAAAALRGAIGRQARIRQVPELRFARDPAIVEGQRIERILRDLDEARSAAPPSDTAEPS